MDPELWELLKEGDSEDEIAAIVRLGQPSIVPKGVRVVAQFGDIATIRMERGKAEEVRAEEGVTSLKASGGRGRAMRCFTIVLQSDAPISVTGKAKFHNQEYAVTAQPFDLTIRETKK